MKTSRLSRTMRVLLTGIAAAAFCLAQPAPAEESPYEIANETLHILEEEGYNIRQDFYQKPLDPSIGKGVRVQLFKGNEYVFVGALSEDTPTSSLKIQILDGEGHVAVGEGEPMVKGRVVQIKFKPRKTGFYVVAMRQVSPTTRTCALFMGFR